MERFLRSSEVACGRWAYDERYGTYCPECGAAAFELVGRPFAILLTPFCWNCGASMKTAKEEGV